MEFTRPSMLYDLRSNPAILCRAADYPVVGKPIIEVSRSLGTKIGANFLGLRLPDEDGEERWLVCALWCADNWLTVDGHPIHAHVDVAPKYNPLVFMWDGELCDEFTSLFADQPAISEFVVEQREMHLVFGSHEMRFDESPDCRPTFPSGTRRELTSDDDLRDAWVIAKSRNITVQSDD